MRRAARLIMISMLGISSLLYSIAPIPAEAQSSADLSSTIRMQIMSDPRTTALTQVQVDEMVSILTRAAQAQGLTAKDIAARPIDSSGSFAGKMQAAYNACEGTPAFFCAFDLAFGFLGPDSIIPFILGAASMGLIWILAEMIHRRRYPWPGSTPSAPISTAAQ